MTENKQQVQEATPEDARLQARIDTVLKQAEEAFNKSSAPNWRRQSYLSRQEDRARFIHKKEQEQIDYYDKKLIELVEATLSSIDNDTTQSQINQMIKIGDKEWRAICARSRQVKTYVKLPIDLYIQIVVHNLMMRENERQKALSESKVEENNTTENQ